MSENNQGVYDNVEAKPTKGLNIESEVEMSEFMKPDEELSDEANSEIPSENTEEKKGVIISEEDMLEEFKKIDEMNFVELLTYDKSIRNQKIEIENRKEFAVQLAEAKKEFLKNIEEEADKAAAKQHKTDLAKEIEIADLKSKLDLEDDDTELQEFLDNYDESMERVDKTIAKVEEKFKEFENVKKTSTYMNKAMTEIAEKEIKKIDDAVAADPYSESKYTLVRRHYERMIKLYATRDDLTPIISRVDGIGQLIKNFYNRTIEENKKDQSMSIDSARKNAGKEFMKTFSIEQMQCFDHYLNKLYNPNDDVNDFTTFMTQYALYLVHKDIKAIKKGLNKNIDMAIMNVIDIVNDNYDMPNGVEYFNDQLLELRKTVKKYMIKKKGNKK